MIYAKVDVDIIDHPKALAAGALARDLWMWGLVYCRKHQNDGDIPMIAVLTSAWGSGSKANVKLAEKLVAVDLWERTDDGYRVKNYAKKNDTRAVIEERREWERQRKASRRRPSGSPSGTPPGIPEQDVGGTPGSDSDSGFVEARKESGVLREGPPAWFVEDTMAMLDMNARDVFIRIGSIGERWLQYQGAIRRGRGANAQEAAAYLTTSIRAERAESDAKAERRKPFATPPGAVEHQRTKAEVEADAKEISRRMKELAAKQRTGT